MKEQETISPPADIFCIFEKKYKMDSIIIKPRDKKEFNFFIELANRLGVEIKTVSDIFDEKLFSDMEKNKKTPYIEKEEVLKTIQHILNEKQSDYRNED